MKKVKITQEQAEAIERIKKEHLEHLIKIKKKPFTYHVRPWEEPILKLEPEDIQSALFEGYEVEPEFKVGDWVVVRFEGEEWITDLTKESEFGGFYTDSRLPGEKQKFYSGSILRHATPEEIATEKTRRWWDKHGREPWEIKEGDCLMKKDDPHTCTVSFVESVDEKSVLLVNGKRDEFYQGKDELEYVRDKYKVFCFSEDRKDVEHAE